MAASAYSARKKNAMVQRAVVESLEQRTLFSIAVSAYPYGLYFNDADSIGTHVSYDLGLFYDASSNYYPSRPHDAVWIGVGTDNPNDPNTTTVHAGIGGRSSLTWHDYGISGGNLFGFHSADTLRVDYDSSPAGDHDKPTGIAIDFSVMDDSCASNSSHPIRYADGALKLEQDDFAGVRGGMHSHLATVSRSWSNVSYSGGHPGAKISSFGINSQPWIQNLYTGLYTDENYDTQTYNYIGVILGSTKASVMLNWGGSGEFSAVQTFGSSQGQSHLRHDMTNHKYVMSEADGTEYVFADFDTSAWASNQQGSILQETSPGGISSTITPWTTCTAPDSSWVGLPHIVETTYPAVGSASAVVEDMTYTYVTGGDAIASATLSRDSTDIRTVQYSYYGTSEAGGNVGDLKTVTIRDGSATGNVRDVEYYRWYTSNSSPGYTHGLKFWLSGDSYRRAFQELSSVTDQSDTDLKVYADNYFEYDGDHRVVKEIAQTAGCSCTGTDGRGQYDFEYAATNTGVGRNQWAYKTIERLPDHTPTDPDDNDQNIVYTNEYGDPILKIVQDTAANKQYYTYYQYDDQGQVTLLAHPSALTASSGSGRDLVLEDTSGVTTFSLYLYQDQGLVDINEYYTDVSAPEAGLIGYLHKTFTQQGSNTTYRQQMTETTYTDGGITGDGIYFIASEKEFAGAGGAAARTTSYEYTWHTVSSVPTNQMESRITKLPRIESGQNGADASSGATVYVSAEYFDILGNLIWTKDAAGYVNYYEHDSATGALTKQIIDVNPSSISSPAVAGPSRGITGGPTLPTALAITTQMQVDKLGRTYWQQDPNGKETYTVYDDTTADGDPIEVRSYAGWNSTSHQPTGPVNVWRHNAALGYDESLTFSFADSAGLPVSSGIPTGEESLSGSYTTVHSLSRNYKNYSGQVTQYDRYFDLNGLTYSTSPSLGTPGTNFYRTEYAYDKHGLQDRILLPTGTIQRTVYDALGRKTSSWIGTDDTPSTGYWSPSNTTGANMGRVTDYFYDNNAVGDSNLTDVIQHVQRITSATGGAALDRHTKMSYDWRDRLVAAKQGAGSETLVIGGTIEVGDKYNITITDGSGPHTLTYSATSTNLSTLAGAIAGAINDSTAAPFNHLLATVGSSSGANQRTIVFTTDSLDVAFTVAVSTKESDNITSSDGQTFTRVDVNQPISYLEYDNLDEVVSQERYNGDNWTMGDTNGVPDRPDPELMRAKTTTEYDNQGRVFATHTFGVALPDGDVSSASLDTSFWYDLRGNAIKVSNPGGRVDKSVYDGAGRLIKSSTTNGGGDSGSWSAADDVSGDIVLTQTEIQYDNNGNAILVTQRDRFHDAADSLTGDLGNPSTNPKARVTYTANYYDAIDRLTATAEVGTNYDPANSDYTLHESLTSTLPTRSDTALVTSYTYDSAGRLDTVTDPRGIESRTYYDALGRTTKTIEAYADGSPSNSDDLTTEYTYDGSDHVLTMKAVLPDGPDDGSDPDIQETRYGYDAPSSGAAIYSNDLLWNVQYPDQSTGAASESEGESWTYNAQGQQHDQHSDRNGTDEIYTYDVLGRLIGDEAWVTTETGANPDSTVHELGYSFDSAGRPYEFTSYGGNQSGNILNQVRREYNGLGQLVAEYQEHNGAVDGSTLAVQYQYSEMDTGNHSRLTKIIYPVWGREVTYEYGSGIDNDISRLSDIRDNATGSYGFVEDYSYLGLGTVVKMHRTDTAVTMTYARLSGETSVGDGGDQYTGLDRFGRIVDQRWRSDYAEIDLDRHQYGYDRDGNRVWKKNAVATSGKDEFYVYDSLNRLTRFKRGTLNTGHTDITGTPIVDKSWALDALGNWTSVTDNLTSTTVNRTHNAQNELTQVGSDNLTYDPNGNMTLDNLGQSYVYDAWNRLVHAGGQGYQYDALGRRIVITQDTPGTDPAKDLYYSAQWQVIQENEDGEAATQYLWSPIYVDAMIFRDNVTQGRQYAMFDANFNVTSLGDGSDGTVIVERYLYDPYGTITVLNADWSADIGNQSDVNWEYLFQGGRYDSASNLYHFRNRDYNPELGRWTRQDPAGYVDGTNLYEDERSAPIQATDWLGLGIFTPGPGVGGVWSPRPQDPYWNRPPLDGGKTPGERWLEYDEIRTPLGLTIRWITAPGTRRFGPGNPLTAAVQAGAAAAKARAAAQKAACGGNGDAPPPGKTSYSGNLGSYLGDYAQARPLYDTNSFIGGCHVYWSMTKTGDRTFKVHYRLYNETTLLSGTRIPGTETSIIPVRGEQGSMMGLSIQNYEWDETITCDCDKK